MMESRDLEPAERNTETMKDVERNLLRESCREKPVEREMVAGTREREIKRNQCLLCLYQACDAHRTKPGANEKDSINNIG